MFEDKKGTITVNRRKKDNATDKQLATKQYSENYTFTNPKTTNNNEG